MYNKKIILIWLLLLVMSCSKNPSVDGDEFKTDEKWITSWSSTTDVSTVISPVQFKN